MYFLFYNGGNNPRRRRPRIKNVTYSALGSLICYKTISAFSASGSRLTLNIL
uniref:Uncharacterized protein n=1 Tax=uncultured Desulfobacterium sp. TaxID=201089 RepID=E1YKG6_9BACT|nr:unknown protein [uncultured Desulfobacterium sp.]